MPAEGTNAYVLTCVYVHVPMCICIDEHTNKTVSDAKALAGVCDYQCDDVRAWWVCMFVHTYVHTYMHTCVRTFMHCVKCKAQSVGPMSV